MNSIYAVPTALIRELLHHHALVEYAEASTYAEDTLEANIDFTNDRLKAVGVSDSLSRLLATIAVYQEELERLAENEIGLDPHDVIYQK